LQELQRRQQPIPFAFARSVAESVVTSDPDRYTLETLQEETPWTGLYRREP
jgi:hypothetical protein